VYFNDRDQDLIKTGNRSYEIGLSKINGGLTYITDKATGKQIAIRRPDGCLWAARFNGVPDPVDSCVFSQGGENQFSYIWNAKNHILTLAYTYDPSSARKVNATVTISLSEENWFDLQIKVENQRGYDINSLAFPASLAFYTDETSQALLPILPGIVLEPAFFAQKRAYSTTYPGYPGVFADFLAVSSGRGAIAIYSIGEKERLIPVNLGLDATNCLSAESVCLTHIYKGTIKDENTWLSPRLRMRVSDTWTGFIQAFRTDDGLADVSSLPTRLGSLYDQLVRLPLYKADATQLNLPFEDYASLLEKIPEPGLLHPVGYGPKGFDRSYPDFIPPDERWGSTQDFAEMVKNAQRMGFLVMPYTNPTWWDGDSPTLRSLPDGTVLNDVVALNQQGMQYEECYGCPDNPKYGYVVSPFSSFVKQRLSQLQQQMTQIIPSDLLFEDQIGARPPVYDYNQASPLPDAYMQGWVEHIQTYANARLMTELGFDRLVGFEVGLNGSLLLPERAGTTNTWWGKDTWHIFPFAPMAARDKVLFYQHDLAPETFTHDKATLAWNTSMGYMLSFDLIQSDYGGGAESDFIRVAGAFQKYVLSQYASERITGYANVEKNITQTNFETFSIITNWDADRVYQTDGFGLTPQGVLIRKKDGSLTAGVFVSYNDAALSTGDHYLIEERSENTIIVRQPLGADTMITVKPLAAWQNITPTPGTSQPVPITAAAYDRHGRLLGSAPAVTRSQNGLTFLYNQVLNGQAVAYYLLTQS
jgi:hypothetical protein